MHTRITVLMLGLAMLPLGLAVAQDAPPEIDAVPGALASLSIAETI